MRSENLTNCPHLQHFSCTGGNGVTKDAHAGFKITTEVGLSPLIRRQDSDFIGLTGVPEDTAVDLVFLFRR